MASQQNNRIVSGIIGAVLLAVGIWYVRANMEPAGETITQVDDVVEKQCLAQTLADQVAAADLILTGEVFVVLPDEPDALVYIKPLTVYKGKAPTPLIIRAEEIGTTVNGSGGSQEVVVLPDGTKENELHFASGQAPYLLFLRASDNKFLTSRCDGSRLLGTGLTIEEEEAFAGES